MFQGCLWNAEILDHVFWSHVLEYFEQDTKLYLIIVYPKHLFIIPFGQFVIQFRKLIFDLVCKWFNRVLNFFRFYFSAKLQRDWVPIAILSPQFFHCSYNYNFAVDQYSHSVTDLFCFMHVMSSLNLGTVFLPTELENSVPNLQTCHGIYPCCRLVEEY